MSFADRIPSEHQDSGLKTEMSTSETDTEEGVFDRNFRLCPMLSCIATEELIRTCDECKCFFVYCCHCNNAYGNDGRYDTGKICHHFRLVFTDGACRMNGQAGATAGVGIACSEEENHQLSIPITDEMDPGQRRTSQRAELWAALTGLRYLVMSYGVEKNGAKKKNRQDSQGEAAWVIATDSEYVVKGMTEWLPAWKVRNPVFIFQQFSYGDVYPDLTSNRRTIIVTAETQHQRISISS